MNIHKLIISLSVLTGISATGCLKEVDTQNPYVRNKGEAYMTVSTERLDFSGRGGALSFTVETNYDATLEAPEWISLASTEVPGDGRTYTLTATASRNNEPGGADRTGVINIESGSLSKSISVAQPYFERPDIPQSISNADELVYFLDTCAAVLEEGETISFSKDIDMKGKTFQPAEYFKGVINGNGFRIRNLSASTPLILRNEGVINNLVIDASGAFEIQPEDTEQYFGAFAGQNFGKVEACVNEASFFVRGARTAKLYLGGIVGYHNLESSLHGCVNKGSFNYSPDSATANAYMGGIAGYSYGSIDACENYGPFNCTPIENSAVYFIGGITARQQNSVLSNCINHREARISTNKVSGSGKSYIGGIVGYVEGAPASSGNRNYADLEINLKAESYIGGLQGWQAKVTEGDAVLFENSIVNCNITAQTKASGQYGNNPCKSAGLVTGRFSGQSGYSTLHYGTADSPIRVSGSITCLSSKVKQIAQPKDYQALLDGDGSKTSVNGGSIPEADYNSILYEVCGDGQTGDPEDLIVKTDGVRLSIPASGGEASFSVRGNYPMTISTEAEWLEVSPSMVKGDGAYHDIKVSAAANEGASGREGTVLVTMPMGSTEAVIIVQEGVNLPPEPEDRTKIKNAADFEQFVKNGSNTDLYPAGTVVSLTDDIDLKDIELPSIDAFAATLDGQGHSLKNWAAKAPLVNVNTGTLKNIVIDQSCSMALSENMAFFAKENGGTITACTNLAPLNCSANPGASGRIAGIAATNKGLIQGCTNRGDLSFSSPEDVNAMYLAGIAGSCGTGASIEDCENYENITYRVPAGATQTYKRLAGITGMADVSGIRIARCVNRGAITMTVTPGTAIKNIRNGGIAGETKNEVDINECKNYGNLSCDFSGSAVYLGGLVGYFNTIKSNFTTFAGCVTACNISGAYAATSSLSSNPLECCGLVFGSSASASGYVHTCGTESAPIKVSGSLTCSDNTLTLTESNFQNGLNGNKFGNNLVNGSTETVYNAVFAGSQAGQDSPLKGKKFIVIANSMVYYGGFVQKGNQGKEDPGMFYKLMKALGHEISVIDCTQGGHHLYDYTAAGCKTSGSDCTVGEDLLKGLDLSSFDYVILSESGDNNSNFVPDARAVYKRFTDVNPNVKKIYINHIYSVYKNHTRILDNLKLLHETDGVTIINCGQLGYDIYTGAVKVPGGSLNYSDRYTFCNHKGSDSYHPNPLMGYIMTQMVCCALTGESAGYPDYASLIKECMFASGSTKYEDYYNAFYTTPAALPFTTVIDNDAEMRGIQQLIPGYINKY